MDQVVLPRAQWEADAAAHEERARQWIEPNLQRRARGEKHPIWDFLFDYYAVRPAHVYRWHPGLSVALEDAADAPQTRWRDYAISGDGTVTADVASFVAHRGPSLAKTLELLTAMELNRPQFDCFGLHEWAMVYRTEKPRHDLPLRLGTRGTAEVVESHTLKCTHFDAYRFFTPPAKPLNLTVLSNDTRPAHDQCACLHTGMDLFKWAFKAGPLISGSLLLDCLELAMDIRLLDMEASPYDCRPLGYGVVAIETAEGKADYVAQQRAFAQRAEPLRHQLVRFYELALSADKL